MITKKALLGAINDLDKDLFSLAIRVSELETLLYKKEQPEKRKPGRPRKNKK